ncbi:MAG: hypothetical protein M3R71_02580 [Actinomycetota bacterium]|nr:hypothetical protein [Actinomycetota bacterium]
MPFAAATSHHPVTAHATGEVLGHVLEHLGRHPDLVMLSASSGHAGALEDVAGTIEHVLSPTVLVGATSGGPAPSLSLWAAVVGAVAPLRIGDGQVGLPPWPLNAIVVLATRHVDVDGWLVEIERSHPGVPTYGTVLGGPSTPVLLLGDRRFSDGGVAVAFGPGAASSGRVVPVGRPVGAPLEVTRADGRLIYELDGVPALERLTRVARDEMPAADVHLLNESLHLGSSVADPFPLRGVLGADRVTGALALEDGEPVGTSGQFFVREVGWDRLEESAPAAEAALVFADGESGALAGALGGQWRDVAWTGWQGVGAIGPVKGRTGRHPLSVSLALFGEMNNR